MRLCDVRWLGAVPRCQQAPAATSIGSLINTINALTGAHAAALDYASKAYGNQVKPEAIQPLLITAFIEPFKPGAHMWRKREHPICLHCPLWENCTRHLARFKGDVARQLEGAVCRHKITDTETDSAR